MVRFVDAFSGIGGFRLGIERACSVAGVACECIQSIEIDKVARQVYRDHFGDTPLEDIAKIDPHDLRDHDLLVGDPPCQPFSRNGKYYNHNNREVPSTDARATLYEYMCDILAVKQPKAFVLENVKEIMTIRSENGRPVCEDVVAFAERCGYRVWHRILDTAEHGGIPQQRRRVYFVGIREDLPVMTYKFPSPTPLSSCVGDVADERVDDKYLLENLWRNRRLNGGKDGNEEHGISGMLARLAEKDFRMPAYTGAFRGYLGLNQDKVDRLTALKLAYHSGEWTRPTGKVPEIAPVAILYGDTPSGAPRQQDKLYSHLGISPTIATFSTPAFDFPSGWRLLTPRECARLQGFPDDFELHPRDAVAYKQVGNAVTVAVVAAVITNLLPALRPTSS